jgi:hypothetical protein
MPDISTTITNQIITVNEINGAYQWIDCDNLNSHITGETDQSYTPSVNGNYAVIVELNGCIDTSDCVLFTELKIFDLISNKIELHPNPATDMIYITSDISLANIAYNIVDLTGRVVQESIIDGEGRLDVKLLTPGSYYIELKLAKLIRLKFVKQ